MPEQRPTAQKVARNTVFNAIGRFASMAISLFLTPYIVGKLGNEAFGVWALLFAVTNFAVLFDLGIATAYMKHIAEFHAKNEPRRVNQVINTGLFFSTAFGLLILGLGVALSDRILGFFNCTLPDARFALIGVLVIFTVNYCVMIFRAVLNGLQRLDVVHGAHLVTTVMGAVCTVVLLERGLGIRGLVISNLLVTAVCSAAFIACACRVFPPLRISLSHWDKAMFKRLFGYGIQVQVAMVSETVNAQVDKVLLGHFVPGKAVITFYELGGRISGAVRSVSFAMLGAIEAAAAELYASDRHDALDALYHRASRYMMAVTAPMCVFVMVFANDIMLLYMGETGYEMAATAVRFLAVAYCSFLFCAVPKSVARGMAVLKPEVGASLVVLVLNAALSYVLVLRYGFVGALYGTMVASIAGYVYYMVTFHRKTQFSLRRVIEQVYLRAAVACAGAVPVGWLAGRWAWSMDLPSNRWGYGVVFVAEGAAFTLAYAVLVFLVRCITWEDVTTVAKALNWPILKRLLGRRPEPDEGEQPPMQP